MFWEKFFGKKKEPLDVIRELNLSSLKIGYLVDYDLKTWEVTAQHKYDWGGAFVSQEWELRSANQVCYLEREKDDEIVWTLSKKIPLASFPLDIKTYLMEHEDPPKELVYQGIIFKLESEAVGRFYQGEKEPAIEFICWDYLDPSGERVVTIEQWGERDFEAAEGKYVEEYQFSNILPRENTS